MSDPTRIYVKSMAKKFRHFATWLPGEPLRLGDYGILEDKYMFRRVGNIKSFNIEYKKRHNSSLNTIHHSSKKGIEVSFQQSADILDTEALYTKVIYKFNRSGAFVFNANNVNFISIEEQSDLSKPIVKLLEARRWDRNFKVITGLAEAETVTILIADSKSSVFEVKASGDIASEFDIANANIGLSISYEKEMNTIILAKNHLNPLFRLSGIKKKTFIDCRDYELSPHAIRSIHSTSDNEIIENPNEYYFGEEDFEDLFSENIE
jgi:hypothetical protein